MAAASPFIGQGESAMLIKPFVAHLVSFVFTETIQDVLT